MTAKDSELGQPQIRVPDVTPEWAGLAETSTEKSPEFRSGDLEGSANESETLKLAQPARGTEDAEMEKELSALENISAEYGVAEEEGIKTKPFTFAELDAIDWDSFDWEDYDLEGRFIATLTTLRLDAEQALMLLRQHQRIYAGVETDEPYGGDMWRLHRDLFLRRFRQSRGEDENEDIGPGEIRTLTGAKTGLYEITTKNGMRYVLNLDTKTIIRHPPEGREWDDQIERCRKLWTDTGTDPALYEITTKNGMRYTINLDAKMVIRQGWDDSGLFTSDKQVVHYKKLWTTTVGESMVLESQDEWWASAAVTSIRPFDNFSTSVND